MIIGFVLVLVVGAIALNWTTSIKGPSPSALAALTSDDAVSVTANPNSIVFEPVDGSTGAGLAFYPGGGVDFRAYAPLARAIAARGHAVVLLRAPLALAFFAANAADGAREAMPQIERWAVGGHSLGGVVAAGYAANHPDVRGLALWASYPANDELASSDLDVVSIFGSADGLTSLDDIERSRDLLPPDTRFIEIAGGNHAQFGAYGPQDGDREAAIAPEVQWALVAEATAAWLDDLSP